MRDDASYYCSVWSLISYILVCYFLCFQAEDGIRDYKVTGVQTCALPISGNFIAGGFLAQLDADKNGSLSRDEFVRGFEQWFKSWDKEKSGVLTEEQLRAGLNETDRKSVV